MYEKSNAVRVSEPCAPDSVAERLDKGTGAVAEVTYELAVKAEAVANRLIGSEPENESGGVAPRPDGFLHRLNDTTDTTLRNLARVRYQLERIEGALGSI